MFRNSLRVLSVVMLVVSLSLVTAVVADASPGLDQAGSVAFVPTEQASGILGWFEALLDRLLSVLVGQSCSSTTDPQCDQGDAGGSMDPHG